jgi:hypothetical protein
MGIGKKAVSLVDTGLVNWGFLPFVWNMYITFIGTESLPFEDKQGHIYRPIDFRITHSVLENYDSIAFENPTRTALTFFNFAALLYTARKKKK